MNKKQKKSHKKKARKPVVEAPRKPEDVMGEGLEQLSSLPLAHDTLSLLADRTRLAVVMALKDGPKNVTEMLSIVGGNQPTLSHHLMLLRVNGLVVCQRNGRNVVYSLGQGLAVDGGKVSIQTATVKITVE